MVTKAALAARIDALERWMMRAENVQLRGTIQTLTERLCESERVRRNQHRMLGQMEAEEDALYAAIREMDKAVEPYRAGMGPRAEWERVMALVPDDAPAPTNRDTGDECKEGA